MKKLIAISTILVLLLSSCASQKTVRYTIASQMGDCVGVDVMKCMLIKKGDATDWQFFYSSIQGFDYHEGYEYVIDVKEEAKTNTPADASSINYTMTKEVSKTLKTSEGLPQSVIQNNEYQCTGKVVSITTTEVGKAAATVIEVMVTSSANSDVKEGDIIYCELVNEPRVKPVKGREYAFKAKYKDAAHAKGMYLLETDVLDLTR